MDPNACLDRIINAKLFNDMEELYWAIEDLLGWLRMGGFAPNDEATLAKFEGTFKLPYSRDALVQVQNAHKK